jgi:hypothetical protein
VLDTLTESLPRLEELFDSSGYDVETERRDILLTVAECAELAPEVSRLIARDALFVSCVNPYAVTDRWKFLQKLPESREVDQGCRAAVADVVKFVSENVDLQSSAGQGCAERLCEGLWNLVQHRPGIALLSSQVANDLQSILAAALDEQTMRLGNPGAEETLYYVKSLVRAVHSADPDSLPVEMFVRRCLEDGVSDRAAFAGFEVALQYAPDLLSTDALAKYERGLSDRIENFNLARLSIEGSLLLRQFRNYRAGAELLEVSDQHCQEFADRLAELTSDEDLASAILEEIGGEAVWRDGSERSEIVNDTTVIRIQMVDSDPRRLPETPDLPFGPEDREEALEALNENYGDSIDRYVRDQTLPRREGTPLWVTVLEERGDEALRALGEPERGEVIARRWGEVLAMETNLGCYDELPFLYSRLQYLEREYPEEGGAIREGVIVALKHGMDLKRDGSRSIMYLLDAPVFSFEEKVGLIEHAFQVLDDVATQPVDGDSIRRIRGRLEPEDVQALKSSLSLQLSRNLDLDAEPIRAAGFSTFAQSLEEKYQRYRDGLVDYLER